MNSTRAIHHIYTLLLSLCTIFLYPESISAFDIDTYAGNSVLSSGRWVKVSVAESGLYSIPASTLRSWGFSNPANVRVYGYGGNQLSDVLAITTYTDDLPLVQSVNTDRGVTFYAVGPERWSMQTSGMWIHSLNQFSSVGYYFITENPDVQLRDIPVTGSAPAEGTTLRTTFISSLFHEVDQVSPGQAGHLMVGEDFRYTRSQTFNFQLPGRVAQTTVQMECSFLSKTYSSSATISFTANGESLPSSNTDIIAVTKSQAYYHGVLGNTRKSFQIDSDKLALGVTYTTSGVSNGANLNYLTINYTRQLQIDGGKLLFRLPTPAAVLGGATDQTRVWDVTDPLNITAMPLADATGGKAWVNDFTGNRNYAAWNDNASMPTPTYVGTVRNQNLHALEVPDMVIFTTSELATQAQRIAELHRNDPIEPLSVEIVDQNLVFNEFSSGAADVNAFRRMLKMLYDRSSVSEGTARLRYALFLGRGFHDNRRVSSSAKAIGRNVMPVWESASGLDDNTSYTTDDIIGFLEDGSGSSHGLDKLSIAIGRIPASTMQEAKNAVDKLYEYYNSMPKTAWKNQILLLADDEDTGQHMTQTEQSYNNMSDNAYGTEFMFNKVYIDAFERRNGGYPEARTALFRKLNEGVMWWNYVGHANMNSMSHELILTLTDMQSLYLKQYPILFAATCDLLRWDNTTQSGAEVMYFMQRGGTIATISATRPVYITANGPIAIAIGAQLPVRDENGNLLTVGEIYRRGKNSINNDTNKLRYVLMGDPAMRIAMPAASVRLESIDGVPVNADDQPTIKAHANVTITGAVYNTDGSKMTDFNGYVAVELYDAEKSTTSHGYGESGIPVTFEEQGSILYSGRTVVTNGEFTLKIAMPMEIAGNFRPAALNMYAYSSDANDTREAIGCNRDFFVYGYDETVEDDTTPPAISGMVLNHPSFTPGDNVNESPMVIASVSDDTGINLSSAGIGHQMTLTLDGTTTYSDVSLYYTPDIDQDRVSGQISYPMENLTPGNHNLRLRVWDTSGNMAESDIEFFVIPGMAPKIFDIYSDANPATVEANFYLSHNRPDATLSVTVSIYNLNGRKIWETTSKGRSDMFLSTPVTWDLTDEAGRKVNRGIYIYRATITADGTQFDTGTRKIAVAPQ